MNVVGFAFPRTWTLEGCRHDQEKRIFTACPANGKHGKPVRQVTVEALIKAQRKHSMTSTAYFYCDSPECDVVYFSASGNHLIVKNQLRVRVGAKEMDDPIRYVTVSILTGWR